MADDAAQRSELTIGTRYLIDLRSTLADFAGCRAYRVLDTLTPGSALLGLAPMMPSARFADFAAIRHPSVMPVLTYDVEDGSPWAICNGPPGPSLGAGFPVWRENHLIDGVIRPIAGLLQVLAAQGLTLRGIRPDNLFVASGAHQLILGPLGLTPPGFSQPCVFESLSSAVCAPVARGGGRIADDVFSLGVMVLALCFGEVPLAGMPDEEVLARRFQVGTFAAYTQGRVLPSGLASLLGAMLSDNPDGRPGLNDLVSIAQSKVFSARPEPHARAPLVMGDVKIRTVRALAWHASRQPDLFSGLLQKRAVDVWLQRELELSGLASEIDQVGANLSLSSVPGLSKGGSDAATPILSRVIGLLDPAAPMFLGGRWFWPEALPAMLAHAQIVHAESGRQDANVEEHQITSIASYLSGNESAFNEFGAGSGLAGQLEWLLQTIRRSSARGRDRILRLPYDTNPWMPCLSPRCVSGRIVTMGRFLAWLDGEGERATPDPGKAGILDVQMHNFLASHAQRRGIVPLAQSVRVGLPVWLADLMLLAVLQARFLPVPLTGLAGRFLPLAMERMEQWRSVTARKTRCEHLEAAARQGDLKRMIGLIEDGAALEQDRELAALAASEVRRIDETLAHVAAQGMRFDAGYRETGRFVATAIGIAVALVSAGLEFAG